jgi:hypothetical protein
MKVYGAWWNDIDRAKQTCSSAGLALNRPSRPAATSPLRRGAAGNAVCPTSWACVKLTATRAVGTLAITLRGNIWTELEMVKTWYLYTKSTKLTARLTPIPEIQIWTQIKHFHIDNNFVQCLTHLVTWLLLIYLMFMGPCIVNIFQYISNKMQLYTVYLYLETAVHVSGGTSTHHEVTVTCRYSGR